MAILLSLLVIFVLSVVIFVNFAPQFGAVPEGDALEKIKKSPNYRDGVFQNLIETRMDMKAGDMASVMYRMFFKKQGREPEKPLPVKFKNQLIAPDTAISITWYGHSAILLELEGRKILIDPMLGPVSAPISFGTKRFPYEQGINLETIPEVDAVLFSHDHYDHLDYLTVKAIKDKVGHFYTAQGVGGHLIRWGVHPDKITELDWWETAAEGPFQLVCTPARHFSGRGLTDRNKTQWASWVIKGTSKSIYFSGDSGYGPHFTDIGATYGPFDFAMIECGQYNELWESIHMMPEQSVQAALDLKAKVAMPIHWGAFSLSLHHWTEPIERFNTEAVRQNLNVIHPYIGEKIVVTDSLESEVWWE